MTYSPVAAILCDVVRQATDSDERIPGVRIRRDFFPYHYIINILSLGHQTNGTYRFRCHSGLQKRDGFTLINNTTISH